MPFSMFYIGVHLVALIAAIAFVASRSRWVWFPYIVLLLLEVPVLWRVLEGETLPAWFREPISAGIGVIVFGLPFVRWLRTRTLLQQRFEKIGLATVLAIHGVSLIAAIVVGMDHHRSIAKLNTEETLRLHAIGGSLEDIENTLAHADQEPSQQRELRSTAIDAALNYGSDDLAMSLIGLYPSALTAEHLAFAIRNMKANFVANILSQSPHLVDDLSRDGSRPLNLAATSGDTDMVDLLLKHADPTKGDEFGTTPLMHAASYGHLAVVKKISKRFPDTMRQTDDHGRTPLMYTVAMEGKLGVNYQKVPEVVALFIETKANVNAQDSEGESVLGHALTGPVWSTLPETVRLLRQAGAQIPDDFDPTTTFTPMKTIHFEGLDESEQKAIWDEVVAILSQ